MKIRICPVCNLEYASRQYSQKCCSKACANTYRMNKKPKRHCDFCNKEINDRPRAWIRHKTCFCDKICEGEYRKNRIINKCVICGESIETIPSKNKITCSKECMKTHLHKSFIDRPAIKRSFIEVFIEHMLLLNFSDLNFIVNDRKVLEGFELDFWFPDLKIGVECSGPHHYIAIHGEENLSKIQLRDKMKRGLASSKNITVKTLKNLKPQSKTAKTQALNTFKEFCNMLNLEPTIFEVNMKEVYSKYLEYRA